MISKDFDIEDDEQYSTAHCICPYCGCVIKPWDDNFDLYDEVTTNFDCPDCDENFKVSVHRSYSWTTKKVGE